MKKVIWEVRYLASPPVYRYCKKCGQKTSFVCSDLFRVNAQRRTLDIWLIYKCSSCDTTWNATVYTRVSPQSMPAERLDLFHKNDRDLAEQYALDCDFLHRNGAEVGLPEYCIEGDMLDPDEPAELEIRNLHGFPLKVSSLLREQLHLSQKAFFQLVDEGRIRSLPAQDLKKCKLKESLVLLWQLPETAPASDADDSWKELLPV